MPVSAHPAKDEPITLPTFEYEHAASVVGDHSNPQSSSTSREVRSTALQEWANARRTRSPIAACLRLERDRSGPD